MIVINDKYAIKSDINQWMICRKIKETEKNPKGWEPFKYYHSLESLSHALSGILLRTSDYESFAELSARAGEISAMLDKKLKDALQ